MDNDQPRAYILAGGRSRRFGADKARAPVDGQPLLQRVAATLAAAVGPVTVVAARHGEYEDLGLRTIADNHPDRGPMGGLEAALADRGHGWVLLASCDFVCLRSHWIDRLLQSNSAAGAAAFRGERWEPLLGLYHTEILPLVRRRLAANQLAVKKLLDDASATPVPLPQDWPQLAHVNTRVDLAHAILEHVRRKD